jgi:hypothetical protein
MEVGKHCPLEIFGVIVFVVLHGPLLDRGLGICEDSVLDRFFWLNEDPRNTCCTQLAPDLVYNAVDTLNKASLVDTKLCLFLPPRDILNVECSFGL